MTINKVCVFTLAIISILLCSLLAFCGSALFIHHCPYLWGQLGGSLGVCLITSFIGKVLVDICFDEL